MAPKATSYLTIEEGRVLAGLADDDTSNDTIIDLFIDAASEWIDDWCNRDFAYQAAAAEKFAAPADPPYYYCKVTPVIAVTSIQDTEPSTPVTLTAGTDYELEEADIGAVRFLELQPNTALRHNDVVGGPMRHSYKKRYTITYEGGFETPNQSGTGATALPGLIRMATRLIFSSMYKSDGRDPGVTREHLLEMSYWYDATKVDKALRTYLKGYRRWAQAS